MNLNTASPQEVVAAPSRSSPVEETGANAPPASRPARVAASKPKRFSYFWAEDWWSPATVRMIHAFGDALAAIQEAMLGEGKKLPRAQVLARIDAVSALCVPAVRTRWRKRSAYPGRASWESVARAILHCAGLKESSLENFALWLVKRGEPELAWRLIEIDEFLQPGEAGPARNHVLAVTGRRRQGLEMLDAIARHRKNPPEVRVHAIECVVELRDRRRAKELVELFITDPKVDALGRAMARDLISLPRRR